MDYATKLLELPIWSAGSYPEDGSPSEHIRISHERARSVVQHVGMTTKDIATLSPKFRDFHTNCKLYMSGARTSRKAGYR